MFIFIILIVKVDEKQHVAEELKNFSDNDESVEGSANSRNEDSEEEVVEKDLDSKKND
jgi:hypothetical protein